ncbi:MAG: hypothetical protein AAF657_00790 [Acidobacteriota bacterium]
MNDPFELSIGGLGFTIELPPRVRLIERDTVYAPFLVRDPAADSRIRGDLTLKVAPDTESLDLLFDTEETWRAFADGDDVLLRLRSTGDSQGYLWLARLVGARQGPIEHLTIHCGDRLVECRGAIVELTNPLHYPLDQLLAMFVLPALPGALIHAAGLARGGRGIFCAGVSGAGKTTFMGLTEGYDDLDGLSDDRVIVRRSGDAWSLFGTPWAGEGRVAANRGVELVGVTFLNKADHNALVPISPTNALTQLLATTSILWFDRQRTEQAMSLCEALVSHLPCYELHFRKEEEAVDLLGELI